MTRHRCFRKTLMSYKETLIEKDIAAVNYNKKLNEQTDILLKKKKFTKS